MSRFQPPKGTRDFFPLDMAVRRHIETTWRDVSIAHGFDEIDGPTYEHLELYTVKSGEGIVSELFSFRRAGGDVDYALRPEFTPTLARMVAARGASLPMPVKWFTIPSMFRAERPQRGRLREHIQWNVDLLGTDEPWADAEMVAVAAGVFEKFGLTPAQVHLKMSHRAVVSRLLVHLGVDEDRLGDAFALLDRRDKMEVDAFNEQAAKVGLDADAIGKLNDVIRTTIPLGEEDRLRDAAPDLPADALDELVAVRDEVAARGLTEWCEYDLGIVRGLAYYTGTVFEAHETSGRERAIAGGGRYDHLVELFGGAPTPAVGFAMGDVVIRLVLEENGLLGEPETLMPQPDAFVIAAGEAHDTALRGLVAELRRDGLHVRHTYRATRNVGKLLREAAKSGARYAVIIDDAWSEGRVELKDLGGGEQRAVTLDELRACIC